MRTRVFLVLLVAMMLATTMVALSPVTAKEMPLLAKIHKEGVIRVATDSNFPPQSWLNPATEQYEGFDIDVATEIARRLGVGIEWVTPAWGDITAGDWQGQWDMSVGSMTATTWRAEVLYFTQAYYYWPYAVAVHQDNTTIGDLTTDLDERTIGVAENWAEHQWLLRTLDSYPPEYPQPQYFVDDPAIATYDGDVPAIQALAQGDGVILDAVIAVWQHLDAAIDEGAPIKLVGDPVFYEPLVVAFDRSSSLDASSLVNKVNRIIEKMHADGTLAALSMKWYGRDLSVTAG